MRAIKSMTLIDFKLYLREPIGTFFTLAFPALLVLLFGAIYGNEPTELFGGYGSMDISMPGYTGMILATVALLSIPINISTQRETGVLRRLRATPLRPLVYILADLTTNLAITLLGMLGVVLLGWLIYRVRFEGQVIPLILGVIYCGLAMFSLGYLIAGLAPNARAAQVIGMLLLYPMLFLSGAGFPLELLPASMQRVSNFLPLTYVVRLLRGLWFGVPWSELWLPTLVLGVIMVVCSILAARFFRWE
jgi:ABC-2 type transport system permease protein